MRPFKLRAGIFLAPFHPLDEDPTLALHRDLELVEFLDRLGYDEAWIGEHHSGGFEIIASPELFIAAAAARTTRIRLGTGVVSLPYHNPLMVADRILMLDHLTRGRVMFGVGPGLLPGDASMLGVDIAKQRDRMAQALDVIVRLFRGEVVTEKTEWYDLREARCQLRPYTLPMPEMAVASSVTPSGGKAAGKYGLGMLCVAATVSSGYDALATNWQVANEVAASRGATMDANRLRLVGPMHLARTREQAMADVRFGLAQWSDYFFKVNPVVKQEMPGGGDLAARLVESGRAVIGTPEDAILQIERLEKKQGHFGAFLLLAHNWADFTATKTSYELFARYVLPRFNAANEARVASLDWTVEHGAELGSAAVGAAMATIQKHYEDKAKKQ